MSRYTRTITASTAVPAIPEELLEEGRLARDVLSQLDDSALLEVSIAAPEGECHRITAHVPVALLARYRDAQFVPGRQVLMFDSDEEISSEVAAKLLGVSRPYLNELLDVEAIPYRYVGNQRRIMVTDLNDYRERKARRAVGMAKMADIINESEGGCEQSETLSDVPEILSQPTVAA